MQTEFNEKLADVKKQLNIILLNSTFADKVNPMAKISTMITFPEDIDIIKSHIRRIFRCDVPDDIANMTPAQLVDLLYTNNPNFDFRARNDLIVFTQKPQPRQVDNTTNTKWSRRTIFAHIITNISHVMGRTVQSSERISDLMFEASMSGDDLFTLNTKLKELEQFFGIKIDQSMKVYNAANAAEVSFIAQGLAPAHDPEAEKQDPLWSALMAAISIKYLKSILSHNLNIHISVRALSNLASYEEYQELINSKLQEKQK